MKRSEKVSLLASVLQTGNSHAARLRLQQVIRNSPRSLILIDDMDFEEGRSMTDADPVHFRDKGIKYQMTLGEAHQYARRYGVHTLFVLPARRAA